MKNLFFLAAFAVLMTACGSTKHVSESTRTSAKNLEGEKVAVETVVLQGIEMAETLSEDGSEIVTRPYTW